MIQKYFFLLIFFNSLWAYCPKTAITGSVDGTCYFGITKNWTFVEADDFCSDNFDGRAASIHNAFDNLNILQLARKLFPNAENVWLGGTYDGTGVVWLDGSPDDYKNFQPDTQAGNIVLSLSMGKWSTAAWNAQLSFICESSQTAVTLRPTASCIQESPCPTEWTYVAQLQQCYKPIYGVTFANAEESCRSMDAAIVSIHSAEENRVVVEMTKTGITIGQYYNNPLLGAQRSGSGPTDFGWYDGTQWNYTNWRDSRMTTGKQCVMMYADQWDGGDDSQFLHKWDEMPCEWTYRITLCKKRAKF